MSWQVAGWVGMACGSGAFGGLGMAVLTMRFADTRLVGFLLGARGRGNRLVPGATAADQQWTNDPERMEIIEGFAAHSSALHAQVSSYADTLADGDPVLRERLRRFERGGGRSW